MAEPVVPAFGTPLADLFAFELKRDPTLQMPLIISKSLAFLMEKGLNTEGLFRVPGSSGVVNKYKGLFDAGEGAKIDFLDEELGEEMTADNIASLLKLYLRELPEPLFTNEKENTFAELMEIKDADERTTKYRELVQTLPAVNQTVVKSLLFYLMQVSANSSTNMMHADNLSIVFGEMAGVFARNGKLIVTWLISQFPSIYEAHDLKESTGPVFQRKLVGHLRSVLGVLKEGNYVWSVDGMGEVRVWQRLDMQFYKAFGTKLQFITPPVFFDEKLWCFAPGVLKTCATATLLDPNVSDPKGSFADVALPAGSLFVVGLPVGDQIWAAGDRVSVISKDLSVSDLTAAHPQTIIKTIAIVGKQVWAIKGKSLLVFDAETRTLVQETVEQTFGDILKICPVGDKVWLVGNVGAQGTMWIINQETFATEKVINKHKGAIYTALKLGSLVWTVAWDCKIYTWKADALEYVRRIPNLHRDAIREILEVEKEEPRGWQVWTGSSDRSINIVFVPHNYDSSIVPDTPEEIEAERKNDEEQERKREEKRKKEAELAKHKRALKQSQAGNTSGPLVAALTEPHTPKEKDGEKKDKKDDKKEKKGKEEEKRKEKEAKEEEKRKKEEEKKKAKEDKKDNRKRSDSKESLTVEERKQKGVARNASNLILIKKSMSNETLEMEKTALRDIEEIMKQGKKMTSDTAESIKEKLSETLASLWKAFDKDSSGKLEGGEQELLFAALYESLHKKDKKKDRKPEIISKWKKFFDVDGDGVLTLDEFQNGMLFLRFADTPEKIDLAEEIRNISRHPVTALHKKENLTERQLLILELFASERDCVAGLTIIDKVFKKSLLDEIHANKKLAKLEKELISLLEPILRVQSAHIEFCAALQARLDQDHVEDRIGDIVKDKVNKFTVYANPEVVGFHAKNLPAILNLVQSNSTLKEVFDDLESLVFGVTQKKMTFFFALTLRRVNQLATRLTSLLEKTPQDHPDYLELEAAAGEAKSIAGRWQ